jgi:hypothetical protein
MNILPFQLATTNDLLTSRAGLVCVAELMKSLNFSNLVDTHFPVPGSNRGFKPSAFVNSLVLMLHDGGECLDDLRHLRDDSALRELLSLKHVPQADSAGDWLRRLGQQGVLAVVEINRTVLSASLHKCQEVTLDIDATEICSAKRDAKYTYNKNQGFMPMVGHIAETGQIVASDFRAGNVAPAKDNMAFIEQCQQALPKGVSITHLRIDAAGYQTAIIRHCLDQGIEFAIRAKMSQNLRSLIISRPESDWEPLIGRNDQPRDGESTCQVVHTIGDLETSFTVVVQRKPLSGQVDLAFDIEGEVVDEVTHEGYLYRAIATNRTALSNSDVIHWYNQRAEHSENRIKELKLDFGANRLPCGDFDANALYFAICTLAYNLFALMRMLLPAQWEACRATTIRWRLYALAGKVVRHGRSVTLKLTQSGVQLLAEILSRIKAFPLPI